MTIQTRLNERLHEIQCSQAHLARVAKVSQAGINKICLGQVRETRKLVAIAQAVGLNAEWLATGVGPRLVDDSDLPQAQPDPGVLLHELLKLFMNLSKRDQIAILSLARTLKSGT